MTDSCGWYGPFASLRMTVRPPPTAPAERLEVPRPLRHPVIEIAQRLR